MPEMCGNHISVLLAVLQHANWHDCSNAQDIYPYIPALNTYPLLPPVAPTSPVLPRPPAVHVGGGTGPFPTPAPAPPETTETTEAATASTEAATASPELSAQVLAQKAAKTLRETIILFQQAV